MVESSEVNLQNVREELLKLTQRLLARDGTYVDIWENEDGGSIGLGVSDTPDGHVAIQSWKSSSHDEEKVRRELQEGILGVSIVHSFEDGKDEWYTISPDGKFFSPQRMPLIERLNKKTSSSYSLQEAIDLAGRVIASVPSNPEL